MTGANFPFNHTGIFTITTHAPGAPTLKALLTVPAGSDRVTGHGTYFQATHPVRLFDTIFTGVVHALGIAGQPQQIYALRGQANPPLLGASYISHLSISLDKVWGKEGKATYTIYHDGPQPLPPVENVPVMVEWLLQE